MVLAGWVNCRSMSCYRCQQEINLFLFLFLFADIYSKFQFFSDIYTRFQFFQIFTQGCIPSLKALVEGNLYMIGGIAIGVALVQLLGKPHFISPLYCIEIFLALLTNNNNR